MRRTVYHLGKTLGWGEREHEGEGWVHRHAGRKGRGRRAEEGPRGRRGRWTGKGGSVHTMQAILLLMRRPVHHLEPTEGKGEHQGEGWGCTDNAGREGRERRQGARGRRGR